MMSRLTRDGTAEPLSPDQILRRERRQGKIHFPCSADHEQDWQPPPVDPYSCYMCDHTYIHTYIQDKVLIILIGSIVLSVYRRIGGLLLESGHVGDFMLTSSKSRMCVVSRARFFFSFSGGGGYLNETIGDPRA